MNEASVKQARSPQPFLFHRQLSFLAASCWMAASAIIYVLIYCLFSAVVSCRRFIAAQSFAAPHGRLSFAAFKLFPTKTKHFPQPNQANRIDAQSL